MSLCISQNHYILYQKDCVQHVIVGLVERQIKYVKMLFTVKLIDKHFNYWQVMRFFMKLRVLVMHYVNRLNKSCKTVLGER